jgi:hypothetical protein
MGHTLRGTTHGTNREREGKLKPECGYYAHCIEANTAILNWQRPIGKEMRN